MRVRAQPGWPPVTHSKEIITILLIALCAPASLASPAEAQIYSWRDENGVLTVSDRARPNPPFEPLIQQHASQQGIEPDLVRAVIQVESGFNPRAVSPRGAMGLMQLMPSTAAEFGVIDPFNPAQNIRAGVRYLRQLLDRYNEDEQLALAAYNAGPGAVDKHGSKIPPYKETQNYVDKITGIRGNIRNAPGLRMYKVIEIVDGRRIVKYTNTRPESGEFEEVRR
jgi:soluble lytic murein transglycosylase-like protein